MFKIYLDSGRTYDTQANDFQDAVCIAEEITDEMAVSVVNCNTGEYKEVM